MLGRGPAQTPNLTPYELLEPQGVPEDVDGTDRSKVEASFAFGKARKRERKLTEGDRGKSYQPRFKSPTPSFKPSTAL